ncbi:DMT family transporter [Marivirga sp. S37H4]|uniref:DMT family transporter n=1 Tax=Marivirga aurantiaca TaxID=2802615 RepID=A0A935C853_9BACT|nr:DMT family transporter [Marivirga aurantiaca]MBK6263503.1 DMT family transporter [Marivirga aurantiaca]
MRKTWQIHGALALVSLIYGANYIIAKGVMPEYMSPNAFILFRASSATLLFWLFHFFTSKEKVQSKRDYWKFAQCAVFGVTANQLIFFNGLNLGSPVNASIIMTVNPVIVLLISAWFLKDKITSKKIIGILLGAVGVILLILNKEVSLDNDSFLGDVFIFLNATFYAIYLVMVRPLMQRYEPITVVKWVFLFGTIMIIPFGIVPLATTSFESFSSGIWWSVVYVVIGTTFLAYLLNAMALKHVSSTIVGYYIYLQPLFATAITLALGLEKFQWVKALFALMIFYGVYLVSQKPKER